MNNGVGRIMCYEYWCSVETGKLHPSNEEMDGGRPGQSCWTAQKKVHNTTLNIQPELQLNGLVWPILHVVFTDAL